MGALRPQKLLEGKRDVVRSLATSLPAPATPFKVESRQPGVFRDADQALPLGSYSELAKGK